MNLALLFFAFAGAGGDLLPSGLTPEMIVTQVRAVRPDCEPAPTLDEAGFLLDTNYLLTRCAWQQSYPAAASSGETLLVAWQDHRGYFQDDIYACRVTSSGLLLDSAGILISSEPWNQQRPAVSYDGVNFLVVWQDGRNGEDDIYAARVSSSGVVLDQHGIAVSTAASGQGYPSVSVSDTLCLVAWQDARGGTSYDVYGARLTRSGIVLDPSGIPISIQSTNEQYPAVSGSRAGWLVVWQDNRNGDANIYGTRVSPTGQVLDSAGITIAALTASQTYPAVAFDSIWLVAWSDQRNGEGDIYAARLDADGRVLDSTGFAVSAASQQQTAPDISADHSHFLVAWDDARSYPDYDVYGARVTRTGAVLEPNGVRLSLDAESQSGTALCPRGDGWLVVWHDSRGNQTWSIFGTRVSSTGHVADSAGILLSPAAYGQYDTDVAFDGNNYLVVWSDFRSGRSRDIYGCRVTPRGQVLDPQGIAICTLYNWQGIPTVAWGDSSWLVVWGDLRTGDFDIFGSRVSPAGEVLDPQGIAICRRSQVQVYPDVAWNRANWLVAWHDFRRYQYDIYGARVDKQGAVLDTGIPICLASQGQYYPAIAGGDTVSLVVWNDARSGNYLVYGARVTQSGRVLDPDGFVVCSRTSMNPDAVSSGTNYLVTWDDSRGGLSDIYGARVSPDGVVLDPNGRPIGVATGYQTMSALTWTGTQYAAVWQDWRNGHDYDIYACYVQPDGSARTPFPVHTGVNEQITPAACAGPGGQILFVNCGWVDSLAGRSAHTYRIWGRLDPVQALEGNAHSGTDYTRRATIVRGVLHLDALGRSQPSDNPLALMDAAGRTVMTLVPGANDVSHLAPGVYFLRDALDQHTPARTVILR